MKAHEFIRETFDLDNRTSISELPDLPISLIIEMLNNYKEGKVKKLLIPRVSNLLNCDHEWKCDTFDCYGFPIEKYCEKCGEKQAI